MAACTIVNKQGVYYVGGVGTDATTVTTGTIKIKGIVCVAAASADTIAITALAGTSQNVLNWASPITLSESFDMHGLRVEGLIVTHSSTANKCIIVTE